MNYEGYDGPTLRSLRENADVALRAVARAAKMSHGHLSKVERGEPGRPVTPQVLHAYQQACGVKLTGAAGHTDPDGNGWRPGHLSQPRRQALNAKIAAVAVGGPLGEQLSRILDSTGRILAPVRITDPDGQVVEQAATWCTRLDLRHGGGLCDQQARTLLRWAVGLLSAEASDPVSLRLHAAVGALAHRAGWAAFDADSHDIARSLLTIGLYTATRADDPDLRAHILADFAAAYHHLGFPDDALQIVRLGEVDERVAPHVRMVLDGVRARAYAAKGDTDACRRHLDLAAAAQAKAAASEVTGWVASIATSAQLAAATGHALATLARRTASTPAHEQAVQALEQAADQLGHDRARAAGLCQAQLASLHLEAGRPGPGTRWARRAITTATSVRSARLLGQLHRVRAAAANQEDEPAVRELVADLDVVTNPQAATS